MATAETKSEQDAQRRGREITRAMAAMRGHVEIGESYVKEAEHSDGDTYWYNYFGWPIDIEAVKQDYLLYEEGCLETQGE